MAMQNGLSCAIINPCNGPMMASYRSFNALMNLDPKLEEFIGAFSDYVAGSGIAAASSKSTSTASSNTVLTLAEAIERGVTGRASEAMKEALESYNISNQEEYLKKAATARRKVFEFYGLNVQAESIDHFLAKINSSANN